MTQAKKTSLPNENIFTKIGHFILFLIMRLLHFTWRYEIIGDEHRSKALTSSKNRNYILCVWHEFMFPCLISESKRNAMLIASRSGGGRAIGAVMEYFGLDVTYGSKNRDGKDKGGKEAREELLNALSNKKSTIITIDGSVGPRRFCKAGPVDLAKKSDVAILPCASLASKYWEFRTWDRLKLPKPFARIIISYEAPLKIPAEISREKFFASQLETGKRINQAENNAKKMMLERHKIDVTTPDLQVLAKNHPVFEPYTETK